MVHGTWGGGGGGGRGLKKGVGRMVQGQVFLKGGEGADSFSI